MAVVYDGFDAFEHGFLARVAEAEQEFLNALQVEATKSWTIRANERLNATRAHYTDSLRVTKDGNSVTVVVPAGIPSAVDLGTSKFDLRPGFISGKSKSLLLERSPGAIRWVPMSQGPGRRAKMIPIDDGHPVRGGRNWHSFIRPRNITKSSVEYIDKNTLPTLMESFVSRVTA